VSKPKKRAPLVHPRHCENEAMFARMRIDEYFHHRIFFAHGVDIFRGVTDSDQRRGLVAGFICDNGLRDELINPKARHGVEPQTWAQAFERGYHTVL